MANVVTVKSPFGQLGTIEQTKLSDALKHGYTVADNSEIDAHNDREEYGTGLLNSATTFGESAADIATLGASRHLENLSGLTTPEAQAARAKFNPVANAAGMVTGIVADPLGTAGLIGKVGSRVAEGAAKVIGAAPETAGVVAKILRAAPAQALGSAVEGAAYGLGQSVSESALGDPDLNAEKVMSNVGFGAILGGGLGATMRAGEIGVPAIVAKAKQAINYTSEKLGGLMRDGFAEASGFISGKPVDAIKQAIDGRATLTTSEELRQKTASEFADALQEHVNKMNDVSRRANGEIRPHEINATLRGLDVETAKAQGLQTIDRLDQTLTEMEAHPALYPSHATAKIKGLADEFKDNLITAADSGEVFQAINELKQNIDKQGKIFGRAISPEYADAANQIRSLRAEIKASLENESLWGKAASRQTAYNDAQSELLFHSSKGSEFQKAFMVPTKTRGGGIRYEVSPAKVQTYFSQIADARGAAKTEALQNFIQSSGHFVDEVEQTYRSVPAATFDKKSVTSVIEKNFKTTQEAIEQAELQKTLGMLGGGGHNAYLGEGAALGVGAFHPALGASIEAFNMARNPGLAIQRLAKIEKMGQKTSEAVQKGARAIFSKSVKVGKEISGASGARLAPAPASLPKAARHESEKDVIAKIGELEQSPERMIASLSESTADLHEHAPMISEALHASMTRATQFLSSKIPQPGPASMLGPKPEYSKSDLNRFGRYLAVVNEPTSVLGQIHGCEITPEAVETLQTVFPKLYAEMSEAVMGELTNHVAKKQSRALPFKTKMALSLFLNQDLDEALTQTQIMSNQVAMLKNANEQTAQPGPAAMKSTQTGLDHLSGAAGLLTAQQASAQRAKV